MASIPFTFYSFSKSFQILQWHTTASLDFIIFSLTLLVTIIKFLLQILVLCDFRYYALSSIPLSIISICDLMAFFLMRLKWWSFKILVRFSFFSLFLVVKHFITSSTIPFTSFHIILPSRKKIYWNIKKSSTVISIQSVQHC